MAKNIGTAERVFGKFYEISLSSKLIHAWSEVTTLRFQETTNKLWGMAKNLLELEKKLAADPNLTATGRFNKMKDAVQTFFRDMGWFRTEKRQAGEKIANLYAKLFTLPASKLNEVVQELRDGELRADIRDLTQPQRDTAYLFAAQGDDIDMLRAFQKSPGATHLVTPEVRRRADVERAQRLDPTAYQQFVETNELLEQFQILAREIEDLAKEFGIDVTKVPLTEEEISDRIRQILETTFGREMVESAEARQKAVA